MKDQFAGYIFDLDGTIYKGNTLIPGADEVIAELQSRGSQVMFLTNKTIESRENYVKKLNRFGIKVTMDHILNPTVVAARYLQEHHRGAKLYVIGEGLIKEELKTAGCVFASSPDETDVVLISWDRDFHYTHLDFAYQAIKRGAVTIATNPDRTCPIEGGDVPDCGAMIGAIEGATGQKVETIMGKPSMLIAETALAMLNLPADLCLLSGDRLETDIFMGKRAGLNTALVLTGVTRRQDVANATYEPDYILESVRDLLN